MFNCTRIIINGRLHSIVRTYDEAMFHVSLILNYYAQQNYPTPEWKIEKAFIEGIGF